MKIITAACLTVALMSAPAAHARKYLIQATGTVERIATVTNGVVDLDPILSNHLVHVGDAIRYRVYLDTDSAQVGSLFDANPTINIYSLAPISVALTMGNYSYSASPSSFISSSIQLWNNYIIGSDSVDSQSIQVFDYPFANNKTIYPFEIGVGNISESININLFDSTATARTNDLITQIVSPDLFGSKLFSYGLLNSTTNRFYHVVGQNMSISIAAVPEPATWAMMTLGFGLLGGALRRRSARVRFA